MGTLRIGIVGGGASAVCLLDALAEREDLSGGRVTVFEPAARPWRGRAYQPDMEAARVNAPPRDMSVRAGDDGHFADWLAARGFERGGRYWDTRADVSFVPRSVYGDYLERCASAAWRRLVERGWRVEVIRDRVECAVPTGTGLTLVTRHGQRVLVDDAVLCVGAKGPSDLYALAGSDRFVQEPYPLERTLSGIPADATVGVIGSGLTAVDVVRALTGSGHRGHIRLMSRRGVLPSVRQRPVHHWLRHFTPERFRAAASRGERTTLAAVARIMAEELIEAGESPNTIRAEITAVEREAPVSRLRRQLANVTAPGMGLRILQQAVPEAGPDVWPLLPDADQDRVLSRHDRTLLSLCCPMSPGNAAALLDLVRSGQLTIGRGLRAVDVRQDGRFTIHTRLRRRTVDYVVNAVNSRLRGFPAQASGLIDSLMSAGLAEPHPRGGLRVERATSRLVAATRPRRGLYALGDLAGGSLYFTFGIQSLVDRAVDIVGAIAGHDRQLANLITLPVRYEHVVPQAA
jgi:uncharacterized NAD(P)/FAD-binding protein YdhS